MNKQVLILLLMGSFCLSTKAFDVRPVRFESLDKNRILKKRIRFKKIISRTRKLQRGSYVLVAGAAAGLVAFLGHWAYTSYYPREPEPQLQPVGTTSSGVALDDASRHDHDMAMAEFVERYRYERTFKGMVTIGSYQAVQLAFSSIIVATILGLFSFLENSSVDALTRWLSEDELEFFLRLEKKFPAHIKALACSSNEYIADLKKMTRQETLETVKAFRSYFAGSVALHFSMVVNDIEDILALSWLCAEQQENNNRICTMAFLEVQYEDIADELNELATFLEESLVANTVDDVLVLERKCSLLMRRFSVRMVQWLKLMSHSALSEE